MTNEVIDPIQQANDMFMHVMMTSYFRPALLVSIGIGLLAVGFEVLKAMIRSAFKPRKKTAVRRK